MIQEFLDEFHEFYNSSGFTLSFEEYMQRMKYMLLAVFIGGTIVSGTIHLLILNITGLSLIINTLVITVALTLIALLLALWYPLYLRDEAVREIDRSLLYSVSFMQMLSMGGLPIERIIERVHETETSEYLRKLLRKFILNVKIFGYNPTEALQDVSERSASEQFRQIIQGIIITIQTSGDLRGLFKYESELLIQRNEEENQRLLNNLGFLSEIYVTLLVIAPLLLMIIFTTFSFASGSGGEGGGVGTLNLIVFAGIPLAAILLMILVDMQVNAIE